MKRTLLNNNWKIDYGEVVTANLPYDCLLYANRDYEIPNGAVNSYYHNATAVFTKNLPSGKRERAYLKISGVLGVADVYLNDVIIGHIYDNAPTFIALNTAVSRNVLKIVLSASAMSSNSYTGLGIGGGVELYESISDIEFEPESLFVTTTELDERAKLNAAVSVINHTDKAKRLVLEVTLYNQRTKRVTVKRRKIRMKSNGAKRFDVLLKVARPCIWTIDDPYMYSVAAKLYESATETTPEVVYDTDYAPCAIKTQKLHPLRGMYVNGRHTLLLGGEIPNTNGFLGGESIYNAEVIRLEKIRELGLNAVRIFCPTETQLKALDDCGIHAIIDIFRSWRNPISPYDVHSEFDNRYESVIERVVKQCRNHPCVVMYSLGNDLAEAYGRNGGYDLAEKLVARVKEFDTTRPVSVGISELVPTLTELEALGGKVRFADESDNSALINLGRERNVFSELTKNFTNKFDVVGYNYLYSRYSTDRESYLICGFKTAPDREVDAIEEAKMDDRIIGDIGDCLYDSLGAANEGEIFNANGDIDILGNIRPRGYMHKVALGEKSTSYIFVKDPDTGELVSAWNFPRYLGQHVEVSVYTGGDVVALYLNDKIVGRKLAGRSNKRLARFIMNYEPGTLRAISFFKGIECSNATLESVSTPKQIKLLCKQKTLVYEHGDIGLIDISVCDIEGRTVPYAVRTLRAEVEGDFELIGLFNADPAQRSYEKNECQVYGGKAQCIVRPLRAGKCVLKITGDGLLCGRITLKCKSLDEPPPNAQNKKTK